ncbi:hypothetical protein Bpfe_007299 [Biomphalaria pfeifferi]|uniref:Uncharacterized protein n=1 Tax=Biomphalaria pfeifferi TaxID=112525 RepID=A0AAD8BYQ2_BIOPF|nr:hypothetical protein Bpfe_007299 [Biomphalaria pfeifferi]
MRRPAGTVPMLQDLNLIEICTSDHISESDLNVGELIPAKSDVVVDEHYKDASWAYLTDEAENDYVFETMATCWPTTVSRNVHGKRPLTQCIRTTTLESTVIATTSIRVKWLATLTSTNSPCVSWLAIVTIFERSKQQSRHRLKRRLANWKRRKRLPRKTVQMASWATGTLPSVVPTDQPPPELSNIHCNVSFRDEKL